MPVRIIKKSEVSIAKQEFCNLKSQTQAEETDFTIFVTAVTKIVSGEMG
jgi:hypothetical protein